MKHISRYIAIFLGALIILGGPGRAYARQSEPDAPNFKDGDEIYQVLKNKVNSGETLSKPEIAMWNIYQKGGNTDYALLARDRALNGTAKNTTDPGASANTI